MNFRIGLGCVSSLLALPVAGAEPALPAAHLRIELRCAPPAAPPVPAGAVVVGTQRSVDPGPTVGVRTAPRAAADALPAVHVTVANGERAQVRWQDERLQPRYLLVAGVRSPRSASRASGIDAGIVETTERQLLLSELDVQPRWPGGQRPISVAVGARQAGRPALAVQTVISVAPDQWTTLARSGELPAPSDAAPACSELQLRVTLRPN